MKLKPKTARRLLLLAVVVVLLVVSAFSFLFVRSWQKERRTQQLRADGMGAFKQADYAAALEPLAGYLRRNDKDREAWLAFAETREKVEEPNGRHIVAAADFYNRALTLDEKDPVTALKLVRLWNTIGKFPEARDLCTRQRPADPAAATASHLEFMLEEIVARAAAKDTKQAAIIDSLSKRVAELDPENYRVTLIRVSSLLDAGRNQEAADLASAMAARKSGDGRFALLEQTALARAGKQVAPATFMNVLGSAAGIDINAAKRVAEPTYTETQFAGQLVSAFDTFGMPRHAILVLQDAATRLKDADARRLLARRLWMTGRSAELLTSFPMADAATSKEPSDILGFIALSLRDSGKLDQAKAILATLSTRNRDYLARGWSKLLTAELQTPEPKAALLEVDNALKEFNSPKDVAVEPVFTYFRGETLLRLARRDEARETWRSIEKSPLAAGWAIPTVRLAETLLDEGQLDQASTVLSQALPRMIDSPAFQLALLRTNAAIIEAGRSVSIPDASGQKLLSSPADILARLDQIATSLDQAAQKPQDKLALRRLLAPTRVALLVAGNQRTEAVALANEIIREPGLLDADLARRLSAINLRTSLGIESALAATAGKVGGDAASIFEQAVRLDTGGKGRAAALKLLDDNLAASPVDRKPEAAAVRAQFLDSVGAPEALTAWKTALKDYPNSLPLHIGAIQAYAPLADAAFVDQIAARLIELGGSDAEKPSVAIRFAKARALTFRSETRSPSARDKSEATALLRGLITEAPNRLDIRLALVETLLLESSPTATVKYAADYTGAIEQLKAAAPLAPNQGPIVLRLADILRRQGQLPEATAELTKLTLDQKAAAADRSAAIDQLASVRQFEAALRGIDILLPEVRSAQDTAAFTSLLSRRGSLLRSLRRDREALETYQLLTQQPLNNPNLILSTALALQQLGDNAGVASVLSKLQSPEISEADRALTLGAFASSNPDPKVALDQYTAAAGAAPDDPRTSLALARFHFSRPGEAPKAEAVVRDALKRHPANPDLEVLLQQIRLAGQDESTANLLPLADALAKHPSPVLAQRAEVLRGLMKARENKSLDSAESLRKLAAEFVDDSATQLLVARRLLELKPEPRVDMAAQILKAAADRFPGDVAVQEQATRVLMRAGRIDDALLTATAWSTLSRQPAADLALAEAQLTRGRPSLAVDSVRYYQLPASIPDDDSLSLGVLNIRVRAGITQNEGAGALRLVAPYLSTSAVVRTRIALPAVASLIADAKQAETWMTEIISKSDPTSTADQLAVADTWAELASRLNNEPATLANRSAAAAESVLQREPASIPGQLIKLRAQTIATESADRKGNTAGRDSARAEAASTLARLVTTKDLPAGAVIDTASLAERLGDLESAAKLYEQHLASPQVPTGFGLAVVKNNLAFILLQQSVVTGKADSLPRAKALAEDAVKAAELVAFIETLGAVSAGMKDQKSAVDAYRRALKLDPESINSKIGLAAALAQGSPEERKEAARLASDADAAAKLTGNVSAKRLKQLADTLEILKAGK